MSILAWDIQFWKECPNVLTPCHACVTLVFIKIIVVEHSLRLKMIFFCLEKSHRFEDSKTFWVPRRKKDFPFSHEWFGEVDKFLGPNGAKHEINSSERANYSLSDGAKQNSVRSIVFELWFFESFFIFSHFCIFPKNEILS